MLSSLDDIAVMAMALGEVTEGIRHRHRTWFVAGKAFAWERPLSQADLKRWGSAEVPAGEILAIFVGDLVEKEAVPVILVQLSRVTKKELREALLDGWLAVGPERLTAGHLRA